MFERAYRQRLEADLARWQADGVIAADAGAAIRATLRPLPRGIDIATVVAIAGGLLVAAAFLAFVAANWTEIARPARFAILLAGIISSYAIAIWFDRAGRPILADLAVTVGSIVFGASVALVGQMYHLASDFAGGLSLWACGALAAAALTGSRGALAVALAAGCVWSGMRAVAEFDVPHLPFVVFWLIAAGLAVVWNAAVARHLVSAAAVAWWIVTAFAWTERFSLADPAHVSAAGAGLLLGSGLALASRGPASSRAFGLALSTYGAFTFALSVAATVAAPFASVWRAEGPTMRPSVLACGIVGAVLAIAAAAIGRRPGPAAAGAAIALIVIVAAGWVRPPGTGVEPWAHYALALTAMICLVISGLLDDVRPRTVAGWIGLAATIAAITWAVKGSLLRRSAFLAVAGGVAVALAILFGRIMPKETES